MAFNTVWVRWDWLGSDFFSLPGKTNLPYLEIGDSKYTTFCLLKGVQPKTQFPHAVFLHSRPTSSDLLYPFFFNVGQTTSLSSLFYAILREFKVICLPCGTSHVFPLFPELCRCDSCQRAKNAALERNRRKKQKTEAPQYFVVGQELQNVKIEAKNPEDSMILKVRVIYYPCVLGALDLAWLSPPKSEVRKMFAERISKLSKTERSRLNRLLISYRNAS